MQIHSGHDFWKWVRKTVVPITYNEWYYNEKPTSRRMRRYLTDMASFRVGAVQMRQLRVKPGVFSGHCPVFVCFLVVPAIGVMQKAIFCGHLSLCSVYFSYVSFLTFSRSLNVLFFDGAFVTQHRVFQ